LTNPFLAYDSPKNRSGKKALKKDSKSDQAFLTLLEQSAFSFPHFT